jgi:exodeoxyribonuclease VII small subunit
MTEGRTPFTGRKISCASRLGRQTGQLMATARPKSEPDPTPAPEKFEELLGRLEQIVSDMEGTDLPLEKLLSSYEEGMRLVKACGDRLVDAEQKVEILSRGVGAIAAPTPSTSPVDPSVAAPLAGGGDTNLSPPSADEEDDDIRLI